jgi:minichromosome maintenance protein 10
MDNEGMADRIEREEGLKRRMIQKEREREIAKKLSEIGGGAGREYMSRAAATATAAAASVTAGNNNISNAGGGLRSSVSSSTSSAAVSSSNNNTSISTFGSDGPRRWDARALGLVGKRGAVQPRVDLGPIKRKRPESSASNSTAGGGGSIGGKVALGWGSSLKNKLTRMKEGERLDGSKSSDVSDKIKTVEEGTETASTMNDGSPVRKKTRFVTEKGIREAGRESLGEPLSAAAKSRRRVVLDDDDDDDDLIIVK